MIQILSLVNSFITYEVLFVFVQVPEEKRFATGNKCQDKVGAKLTFLWKNIHGG